MIKQKLYTCIRVYANGEARITLRDEAGKNSWFEYNKVARFGNSLFIDGEYQEGTGYISKGPELEILKQAIASTKNPDWLKQDRIDFRDPDEKHMRYPDERSFVELERKLMKGLRG